MRPMTTRRNRKNIPHVGSVAVSLLMFLVPVAAEGQYSLTWSSVAGGGGRGTNGTYALISTLATNAAELSYSPATISVVCNPCRLCVLNNEVLRITYETTKDCNATINIYDPQETLFRTFSLSGDDPNEVLWDGRNKPPSDPNSRYAPVEGTYFVEVMLDDMGEKQREPVDVYE